MVRQETVDRALREIGKGYAQYHYFFDRLNSPAWLEPLFRQGFFQKPPNPVRDEQYTSFPLWPESKYLIRMSQIAEAQETVLKIALRIPESENSRVHDDIAEVALSLPAALSAGLVPQICGYTKSPIKLLLPERVAKLIVHLAAGGQGHAALRLARAALALAPDPRMAEPEGKESLLLPEPRSRFKDWYYARIVEGAVPALVNAVGLEAVQLFCELLNDAVQFYLKEPEEGDEDYLYVRHPAIEQGKSRDDIPSILLCATRDAAEQLIASDRAHFGAVLALLQQRRWTSFRRLELHISRVFLEEGHAVAERVFENPEILISSSLRHEAILLLKAAFPSLSPERREHILAWMDAGPSEETIRRWLQFVGEAVTDEKVRGVWKRRRRDQFSILQGQLPEPYQHTYEELKIELGDPSPPEHIPAKTFGAITAQSPKSAEELAGMPADEVLGFLATWVPGGDIFGPTAAGLGEDLTTVVSQRPDEFAAVAEKFRTVDPTYVRCLFAGLNLALKKGEKWDWRPVLELATWVGGQPRAIEARKGELMVNDPDWGWTRDSIIDLLTTGFRGGTDRLPCEHRTLVWDALGPLTDDPDPSAEGERGERFDPASRSINSTRGRALYALLEYTRWVRKCAADKRKTEEERPATLDAMPEVRDVLDRHLDVEREPTLTIRSVYGHQLGSLAGLDWEWFQANVQRILPEGQNESAYFYSAWDSFIVFNRPHEALLGELKRAYQKAVAELATRPRITLHPGRPDESLAEHLMEYYWWGNLQFGGEDQLLDSFYARAPDELRGHAMWFIGRSVSSWGDETAPEVFERLRNLMERRLKLAAQAPSAQPCAKELANFGWWFTSKKFDERWSMETLLATLRLTKKAELDMDVVKRLAELCSVFPAECVSCLGLMIEGDREHSLLLGIEDEAREVIRLALESNVSEAATSAQRLAENLIARGHFGFRNILGRGPEQRESAPIEV
jgi:hypothetical protein